MRIIRIIQLVILLPCLFFTTLEAHSQEIFGKAKNNYRNFAEKKTMVVVNQADFTDLSLADAVKSGWRISLYELCSQEEFQKIKTDTNYYFLLRVEGQFRREGEASLEYLTLVKGGPAANKGIEKMYEIVSMPLQPVGDESGKAFILMPAIINIMQDHIVNVGENILRAYVGNSFYSNRIDNIGKRRILMEREDIGWSYTNDELNDMLGDRLIIVDGADIDNAIKNAEENTIIGFTVSPIDSRKGYSYKLLIDANTYELLFFRRHKISKKIPAGFTQEDLRRISVPCRIK